MCPEKSGIECATRRIRGGHLQLNVHFSTEIDRGWIILRIPNFVELERNSKYGRCVRRRVLMFVVQLLSGLVQSTDVLVLLVPRLRLTFATAVGCLPAGGTDELSDFPADLARVLGHVCTDDVPLRTSERVGDVHPKGDCC
jgi:hypothetical protein